MKPVGPPRCQSKMGKSLALLRPWLPLLVPKNKTAGLAVPDIALRWTATGRLEAERKFRCIKGYQELLLLQRTPESVTASAGRAGSPCCSVGIRESARRQTTGLLQRRHIKIDQIKCIAKEPNSLESVDEGMVHSEQSVYSEYADPKRSEWITRIQPALKKAPLRALVKACGKRLSRREIIELRAGRKKPHRKTRELLVGILKKLLLI